MISFLKNVFRSKPMTSANADSVIALYSTDYPKPGNAFALFEGEWTSAVPGFDSGPMPLFQDGRLDWLGRQCGGFAGKKILELGPLEAGHTFMMAKGGAGRIVSIEANRRAFMRCLIVQHSLKFDAEFLLGDFRKYLKETDERFDFLLASGVLYHMSDPEELLIAMARVSPRIGIWTHYFDRSILARVPELWEKFEPTPEVKSVGAREIRKYNQRYLKAHDRKDFCGAGAIGSQWLERQDILGILEDLGYAVTLGLHEPDHIHGPSLLFYAERKS